MGSNWKLIRAIFFSGWIPSIAIYQIIADFPNCIYSTEEKNTGEQASIEEILRSVRQKIVHNPLTLYSPDRLKTDSVLCR